MEGGDAKRDGCRREQGGATVAATVDDLQGGFSTGEMGNPSGIDHRRRYWETASNQARQAAQYAATNRPPSTAGFALLVNPTVTGKIPRKFIPIDAI